MAGIYILDLYGDLAEKPMQIFDHLSALPWSTNEGMSSWEESWELLEDLLEDLFELKELKLLFPFEL